MPDSLLAPAITFGCVFLGVLAMNLAFKHRMKRWRNSWSTADFLPIVLFIIFAVFIGQAINFLVLERLFGAEGEAISDGIHYGIITTLSTGGMYWYKTRE